MNVTHSIHIEAAPDTVWTVIADLERWPQWTRTVTSVRREDAGELRLGSSARIKQPLQPESRWVVTEFVRGRRFVWETRQPGLHMIGTHGIAAEGGGTRSLLRLEARGPITVLLWAVLRLTVQRALVLENRGLKARCEAGRSHANE